MQMAQAAAPAPLQTPQQLQPQPQQPQGLAHGAAGAGGVTPVAQPQLTALEQMMHTIRTEAAAQKTELQQHAAQLKPKNELVTVTL